MTSPVVTVTETATVHEIAQAILESLWHDLWLDVAKVTVDVKEGIVYLDGRLDRRSEKKLVEKWAAMADGIVGIQSRLTYDLDDRETRPEPPGDSGVQSRTGSDTGGLR